MDYSYIDYKKIEEDKSIIKIETLKGVPFTAGLQNKYYEFGLGLSLDDNNIVIGLHKNGILFENYSNVIKPGMKLISINDKLVGWGEINTIHTLRKQNTKMYNIQFINPGII